MKKSIALLCLGLLYSTVSAQSVPPATQPVVDAERAFAALSKEQNTREAFITHLDENGIVFNQGEPAKGQQLWQQRSANKSLLFWWPVFADIAASGDFGYTTGPFEWSADRSNPAPSAFGYYSTVWKKNQHGVWKVAIDMGIAFAEKENPAPELRAAKLPAAKGDRITSDDLLQQNRRHDAALTAAGKSFDIKTLASESRIHRAGSWPFTSTEAIQKINEQGLRFAFENLGGDMATSGDMGFTYGRVTRTTLKDSSTEKLNYLRVWKRENNAWKIVLDVIGG